MAVNVLTGTDSGVEELKQQCRVADIGTSGVLLKMEVGICKGAWQRAWRYPAYLWSLRWVYAVKKNPEVGIRRIPAYTPQYTTDWHQAEQCDRDEVRGQCSLLTAYTRRQMVYTSKSSPTKVNNELKWERTEIGINTERNEEDYTAHRPVRM